jgi:hypothetical protein
VAKLADILGADREASIEMLRVLEVVERIWHCPLQNASPFECLDWLLRNKARLLKSWSHHFIGNIHLQLAIAKEVLEKLKSAGNHRPLAQHEAVLRREMKFKTLGLSSLQRMTARQESRILWLREGDACTDGFFIKFYQIYWDLIKEDMMTLFNDFYLRVLDI